MSEKISKIFEGAADFAQCFKDYPELLAPIPWGSHVVTSVDNINKGCSCKKKARANNSNVIYKDIVESVFKNNKHLCSAIAAKTKADKLIFKLNNEVIFEFENG